MNDPHDLALGVSHDLNQDPLEILATVLLILAPLTTAKTLSTPSKAAVRNAVAATEYAIRAAHTPT